MNTHYWEFKSNRGNAKHVERQYQLAVKACQKLIRNYYLTFGGLSGYSAHCKVGQYGGVNFNGKKGLGHETFVLREHYSQNECFNFCKTAKKPYDTVVVACLSILKYYLGRYVNVSSDGNHDDWIAGTILAKSSTKLKLTNLIEREAIDGRQSTMHS